MITDSSIYFCYRLIKKKNLIHRVENNLLNDFKIEFNVDNDNAHIFIEISHDTFKKIKYVSVNGNKINVNYHQCNLCIRKTSKNMMIRGIIIPKYALEETEIRIKFKNIHCFVEDAFKIYFLNKKKSYYANLKLFNKKECSEIAIESLIPGVRNEDIYYPIFNRIIT